MDIRIIPIRGSGGLSFLEGERDIPFAVKRVYYIHGQAAGAHRGFHAHRTLEQFLFCPHGSVRVLLDDGRERGEVLLDAPDKGLYLPPEYWHEMIWMEEDSVLCVLASDYYDEGDYIREYGDFMTAHTCREGKSGTK